MSKETSQGHRSRNWGGKFHVDIYNRDESGNVTDSDDGHSPTLNTPPRDHNVIIIGDKKDLPPPYGNIDNE